MMEVFNLVGSTSSSYLDSQFITDIGTIITSAVSWITGNSYLKLFLTAGLVAYGIHLFTVLKGAVRVK